MIWVHPIIRIIQNIIAIRIGFSNKIDTIPEFIIKNNVTMVSSLLFVIFNKSRSEQ